MRTLWFKGIYVEPILDGSKRKTDRTRKCMLQPGDVVGASVGPRPAFAVLRITSREETDDPDEPIRLHFDVLPVTEVLGCDVREDDVLLFDTKPVRIVRFADHRPFTGAIRTRSATASDGRQCGITVCDDVVYHRVAVV